MQFDGFEQYTYISVTIGYLDQAVDTKYIEQTYVAVVEFVALNWQKKFQSWASSLSSATERIFCAVGMYGGLAR